MEDGESLSSFSSMQPSMFIESDHTRFMSQGIEASLPIPYICPHYRLPFHAHRKWGYRPSFNCPTQGAEDREIPNWTSSFGANILRRVKQVQPDTNRNPGSSDDSTWVEEVMREIRGRMESLLGKATLLWLLTARLGRDTKDTIHQIFLL